MFHWDAKWRNPWVHVQIISMVIKVWGSIALWCRVRVSVQASLLSMQQTLNINSASPSPPTFSEDNSISAWQLLFCSNVDTNANGAIDFNEFIDMMVKRRDCLEDDVAHAFKADLRAMFDESLHLEAAATALIIYMKALVSGPRQTSLTGLM